MELPMRLRLPAGWLHGGHFGKSPEVPPIQMARPQMEQAQHVVVEESEPVALNQDLHSAGGRHLSGSKSRIFADDLREGDIHRD